MSNSSQPSLRKQVLEGGIYLTIRRGVGLVLSFIGLLFLTRIIGPAAYGLFNSAFGFFSYILSFGQMGIDVYLIRQQSEDVEKKFHLAFWWLTAVGIVLTLLASLILLVLGKSWVRTEGFVPVTLTLLAALPLLMTAIVPQSYLERQLKYKALTTVEMLSQLFYYGVGITLAMQGWKEWALVGAFLASQAIQVGGFWLASGYRPARYWDRANLKDMLSYSFAQAVSVWLDNLRKLGPSMILLPLAGKEAVGYFALGMRFMNVFTFVSEAIGRIILPAFAKVQHDREKLLRVVNEGIALRLLSVCVFLVAFLVVSPWVLPAILGRRWDTEVLLIVFSLIGVSAAFSAVTGTMARVLHILRLNRAMIVANLALIGSFFGIGALLTWLLPAPYNLYGYASATWLCRFPNLWIINRNFRKAVGAIDYRLTLMWSTGFILLMFAPIFGWWLSLLALPFFTNRVSRGAIRIWWRQIRNLKSKAPTADKQSSLRKGNDEP